jgi:hypothetical protein
VLGRDQPPILAQMSDGVLWLAHRLVQARAVVVTVDETRILLDRGLIGLERGGRTPYLLPAAASRRRSRAGNCR